jgi:hypothetical protein
MDDAFYETPDGKVYKLSELKKVKVFRSADNFEFRSQQQLKEWNVLVENFDSLLSKFYDKEQDKSSIESFYEFFKRISGDTVIYGRIDAYFKVYSGLDRKATTLAHKHETLFFYGFIKDALTALVERAFSMQPFFSASADIANTVEIDKFSITKISLAHLTTDEDIDTYWFEEVN